MKNKLFLILIAFMLTSCESNEIIINRKTSGEKEDDPATLNNEVEGMVDAVGVLASEVTSMCIKRAILKAKSAYGLKAFSDLKNR